MGVRKSGNLDPDARGAHRRTPPALCDLGRLRLGSQDTRHQRQGRHPGTPGAGAIFMLGFILGGATGILLMAVIAAAGQTSRGGARPLQPSTTEAMTVARKRATKTKANGKARKPSRLRWLST